MHEFCKGIIHTKRRTCESVIHFIIAICSVILCHALLCSVVLCCALPCSVTSISQGAELGPDLISRFLDKARDAGENVPDSELIDVVLNFLIAGRDTTACWLSWTFFELSQRPGNKSCK